MNVYLIGMLISMVAYVVIGFFISRTVKNANDFYVAGRKAPTLLIVGSLVASYCSTGLFMGDVGEAVRGTYTPVMITIAMLVTGYVLGSIFFGKYLRRSEVLTIPEFFGKRFQSRKMKVLASLTSLVIYLVYMLSIMQGIGTLMSYVTGLNYNVCIALALVCFTVLTITSGSKGVLITDTIMFGVFTVAAFIGAIVIVVKAGGWNEAVSALTAHNPALFSWHGTAVASGYSSSDNMVWAVMTGITWIAVCMVGPWQSSRYLMAKNEHTVVRSSCIVAFCVFIIEFLMMTVGAFVIKLNPAIVNEPSNAMIWAAMNVMPLILGVVMLTGVLAAGISSATTFLSLIGSAFANDLIEVKDEKKKVRIGRIAIAIAAAVILLLAVINPPNIYIIMCLSGTVVVCAWFPVCIASIWSKRVTRTGAFCGMLFGFIGCAVMKILSTAGILSLPIYLDAFFVGIVLNILGLVIGSALTKVSPEEKEEREKLMKTPDSEFDKKEIKKTRKYIYGYIISGVAILLVLLLLWALPYAKTI